MQEEEDEQVTALLNQGYATASNAKLHQHPGFDLVKTAPETVAQEVRSFVQKNFV